jgi:glycosyltransferase involved in cell wall biosynthesis
MKIIHTEASWGWGGQEIRILTECKVFLERGHDVLLLADPQSQIFKTAPSFKVGTVSCKVNKKRITDLWSVCKALRRLQPDIVVCHSSTDHWLVALARLILRWPFAVVRARHISAKINDHPTTRWLYQLGCESILTTSTSIKTAIIRQGLASEGNIRCIPTGLTMPAVLPGKGETRSRLKIQPNTFVISIVATLRSWKGHEYLIRGLHAASLKGALLLVVGDGPQRQALETLTAELGLKDQVRFMGQLNDVYPALSASDVFVLPSYANEGVPQAILQAMAVGIPILSCPVGGIPEALLGYEDKVLVAPKCYPQISKALRELHETLGNTAAQVGKPWLKYSIENMYQECLSLYTSALERFRLRHP